ncbi:MAG: protein-glutamate O-methyltransferase CheR [Candidatus Wallbacteria bacterium]|nr:protein-glutamate O-methyltransferase CheR [Candidatus Wallbacteria bacterium]
MDAKKLEKIELQLLLETVYQTYGYDFRQYAPASLKRRLWKRLREEKLRTLSGLQERLLHDGDCMERLLKDLSINVTEIFRDPPFYCAFRTKVVPALRTYPFVRIWHAGCSTGEEVYSMAILLSEEGLLERARIYATDFSEAALAQARKRIVRLEHMKEFTQNYLAAGGTRDFADYYTARYEGALFDKELMEHVVFSQHNLVTDGSFNEFNVILCRNVMIYFDRALQARVHELLYDSLCVLGILGLGEKETIHGMPFEDRYECLDAREKIYRKVR